MIISIRYVFRTFPRFYISLCDSYLDACESQENVSNYPIMPIDRDWCMFTIDVWKLYVKENLYDCNGIRTHNDLVHKQTLSHLVKLTKWFSWVSVWWCVWLCVFNMSQTRFAVNLHSVVVWMSRNRRDIWSLSKRKGTQTHNLRSFTNYACYL